MTLAAGGRPSPAAVAVVLLAGTMAAGSANAVNCYLDRDIDAVMPRTSARPLPSGAVSPRSALVFAGLLATISITAMLVWTNPLATALTVAAILGYDVVYTLWLKRTTRWSTIWGATCGAAPVLIGWATVTGGVAAPALAMFGIVFCWQPAHFFALALRYRHEYALAAVPTLPALAPPERVAAHIVGYSWLTVAASLALWAVAMSPLYGVVAVGAAVGLLTEAHRLLATVRAGRQPLPARLSRRSTAYLAIVFFAIALDALAR